MFDSQNENIFLKDVRGMNITDNDVMIYILIKINNQTKYKNILNILVKIPIIVNHTGPNLFFAPKDL